MEVGGGWVSQSSMHCVWSGKLDMLMIQTGEEGGQYNVLVAIEFDGHVGAVCGLLDHPSITSQAVQMPDLHPSSLHCIHHRRCVDHVSIMQHYWGIDLYAALEFWTFFSLEDGVDLRTFRLMCGNIW